MTAAEALQSYLDTRDELAAAVQHARASERGSARDRERVLGILRSCRARHRAATVALDHAYAEEGARFAPVLA